MMAIKDDCGRRRRLWAWLAIAMLGSIGEPCRSQETNYVAKPRVASSRLDASDASLSTFASSESEDASPSLRDALFAELASDAERYQRQFGIVKRVVRLVRPTIVHIDAFATGPDGTEVIDESGSGIIFKIDGQFYVLTNRHVVDRASLEQLKIRTDDGETLKLLKTWSDPVTDVAVVQIASRELLSARLGDSNQVEIGDFVLAVGSPFGLSHSVSYGIISAKGRWDLALGQENTRFQDFLQTDAAINPGNSGGPLLNLKGEVIGINTAIASSSGGNEGIGFSIPVNLAVRVARQLIRDGSVSTAYLGVRLDHSFTAKLQNDRTLAPRLGLERRNGAFVKSVTPGSPADNARLQVGDVVTEFNGMRVEDDDHLINLVSLTPVDEVVALNVIRQSEEYMIHVRVGRRRDFESAKQDRREDR